MHIRNRTSRYHVVAQTAHKIAAKRPEVAAKAEMIVRKYEGKIREHRPYVMEHGVDPPEIRDWRWSDRRPVDHR